MERKVGEIFKYNNEWYQCVKQPKKYDDTVCKFCAMSEFGNCEIDKCSGQYRTDGKSVIFKKLEKFGEPFERNGYFYQEYKVYEYPLLMNGGSKIPINNGFAVQIKQNNENMEETKEIIIPEGWEVDKVENGKVILKKKNPVFPSTFEECLSSVGSDPYYSIHLPRGKSKAINSLCRLIICRDTWWKQLNWNPNWENMGNLKYCIHMTGRTLQTTTHSIFPRILAFPTREVCDEFLEAFNDLIEEAKELL